MALFQPVNVTLALSELYIEKADDRWYGVEPYVIPVFYKVDGERYRATLRIGNRLQPRPGTTEVAAEGFVQFSVDTLDDDGGDKLEDIEEDNPLTYVPPGNLLGRGDDWDDGDSVDVSDVSFTTNLIPIPFTIDVFGLDADILGALQGLTVENEGDVQSALNMVFSEFNTLIKDLFGLDETLETCPDVDVGARDFLSNIEAQFKCMIPGTVGGVFVCMENDEFWENHAALIRSSLRDEVERTINDTINAVELYNVIPDDWTDEEAIADNVKSDLIGPVVANVVASFGSLLLGALTWHPFLAIYGLISSIGWAVGGKDDVIAQGTFDIDHISLEDPSARVFGENGQGLRIAGDGNIWWLRGGLTINT